MVDHQLIELTVPVRPTDLEDPRSGYWADARELVRIYVGVVFFFHEADLTDLSIAQLGQWQQGPARVDGTWFSFGSMMACAEPLMT